MKTNILLATNTPLQEGDEACILNDDVLTWVQIQSYWYGRCVSLFPIRRDLTKCTTDQLKELQKQIEELLSQIETSETSHYHNGKTNNYLQENR